MGVISAQPDTIRRQNTNFVVAHGTRPRVIVLPAAAIGWTATGIETSNSAIRNSDVTQLAMSLVGSAAPSSATLYAIQEMPKQPTNTDWGTTTITGANAINRTVGSFITEGFQIGERYLLQGWSGATNAAPYYTNDVIIQPTAVTATALTVSGVANDTAISTAAKIYRITQLGTFVPTANAGASTSVPQMNLLDRSLFPMLPAFSPSVLNMIELGKSDGLAMSLGSTLSGSQTVEVTSVVKDY